MRAGCLCRTLSIASGACCLLAPGRGRRCPVLAAWRAGCRVCARAWGMSGARPGAATLPSRLQTVPSAGCLGRQRVMRRARMPMLTLGERMLLAESARVCQLFP